MADNNRPTTPRSVKRGKQKEALSRERSSSSGGSIGVPSVGFGSGLKRIPPPVFTQHQYKSNYEVEKPVSVEMGGVALPPINEQMARQSLADARGDMVFGPSEPSIQVEEPSVDPFDTNPYKDKADQIGASHGFGPGVLGDLLIPAGWQEGDPPVDPAHARQIFNQSRATANAELLRDVREAQGVDNVEQLALSEERDEAWTRDYKMDKYILEQRVEIHRTYVQRQREKAAREREKAYTESARRVQTDVLRLPFGPPSSGRPQILDPVLALQSFRSARVQYGANKLKMSLWDEANERYMRSEMDKFERALARFPGTQTSQSQPQSPRNSLCGNQSFEVPNPPGHLPQVTQSFDAAYGLRSNPRSAMSPLPQFPLPQVRDARHGLQGTQRSSMAQVPQVPMLPVHYTKRNLPAVQTHCRPQDHYDSRGSALEQFEGGTFLPQVNDYRGVKQTQYDGGNSFTVPQARSPKPQIGAVYPSPALVSHNQRLPGFTIADHPAPNNIEAGPTQKGPKSKKSRGTPASQKQLVKPQPSLSQPWYQAQVDAANLPIKIPSDEFIRKTLEEARLKKAGSKQATPKKAPKSRRNKSPVDMNASYKVSNAAANALLKAGAKFAGRPAEAPGAASNTVAATSSTETSNASLTALGTEPSLPTSVPGTRPVTPRETSYKEPQDDSFTASGKRMVSGPSSSNKRTRNAAANA